MATGKKTVLLYCDLIHTVEKLTDIQAGKLFKHYLRYINDQSPEADDTLIDIVFEPIKQSLKRDLRKWQIFIEKQRENGQKGGRPKTQITQALIGKPKKAVKVTVKETVKVKVNDTVKDINKTKVYTEDVHDCFENCLRFFPEHLHPKDKISWLDTIEKLNRIEKLPFNMIAEIVERTRNDDFWKKNFLSITKLRKKNKDDVPYITVFYERFKSGNKSQQEIENEYYDNILDNMQ